MVEKSNNKSMRKFKRVDIELAVTYKPINSRNWYNTVTKGIGTGGISLMSMEYLGIETIISIQLSLPNFKTIIEVTGEVLWCDFLFDRKLYESGIKFGKLKNNEKVLISEYIDDFVNRQSGKTKI